MESLTQDIMPCSQALMAALQVMKFGDKAWRRIPTRRLRAFWGRLPFSQALMAALMAMTSGDKAWRRIPTRRLRALRAWLPFSQVLMAALKVIRRILRKQELQRF